MTAVNDLITLSRTLTNTTSTQVSDADVLTYMNIVYHDLEEAIVAQVNEDYFYDYLTTDSVIDQSEYQLKTSTATVEWVKKLLWVSVKQKVADSVYIKYRLNDLWSLDRDLQYYEDNQSSWDPFFVIQEDSIFLFPTPDEVVTDWVKIHVIVNLVDLAAWWAETTVMIPRQWHHLIAIWVKQYIYMARNLINEKNDAKNEYETEKLKFINALSERYVNPVNVKLPNFNTIKY